MLKPLRGWVRHRWLKQWLLLIVLSLNFVGLVGGYSAADQVHGVLENTEQETDCWIGDQ